MTLAPKSFEDTACPEWQVLLDYRDGRLEETARLEIETHVLSCPPCGEVLAELAEDDAALDQRIAASLKRDSVRVDPIELRLSELSGPTLTHVDQIETVDQVPTSTTALEDLRIGPYRILEEIGAGGMGRVYKARHTAIDQVVALKVILVGGGFDDVRRDRFRVEAGALARLDHPNITKLYTFDESATDPYFTMQWVDGRDLGKTLRKGPLEPRASAELMRTVAGAVEHCHRVNIYHRDLKPRNILLRRDGAPLVTDFGLAKLVDAESAGLTADSAVMGTPSYMAPEQAEGRNAEVGPHTDVYGLGAVLYECLTGRPPFVGEDHFETLRLIREGELVAPSELCPGLSPDLEAVCLKCLEREPDRRYPTAQALVEDLDNWLNDRPTRARPLGRIGRVWRGIRRRAKPLALAAVMLLFLAVSAVIAFQGRKPDVIPEPTPEERREQALAVINAKLDRGDPVTLISESGEVAYHRWICGEGRSQLVKNPDGPFEALTDKVGGLLELLPDPRTDRYRIDCELRMEDAGAAGAIGVYVARVGHDHVPKPIHLFLQVVFNDAYRKPGLVIVRRPPPKQVIDRSTTPVRLHPRMHMDEGPYPAVMEEYSGVNGKNIPVLGPRNGKWHKLTIKVGPEGVTAILDGDQMHLSATRIEERLASGLKFTKTKESTLNDPVVQNLQPTFSPRGGMGLVITDGVMSVRRLVVSPE